MVAEEESGKVRNWPFSHLRVSCDYLDYSYVEYKQNSFCQANDSLMVVSY